MVAEVVITAVIATAALAGGLVWASASVRGGVYVKMLCRARTGKRKVALTFDDGPHPERTPEILDVLGRWGVKATFFVVGAKAQAHPELVERIVREGHTVGNHTYSHSASFPWFGRERMGGEIERCDEVVAKITGTTPGFFRPPFGVTNPTLRGVLGLRYTVVGWDVRSLDTMAAWSRERVFARVRRRVRPGSVILLHDDREGGAHLVEMILTYLSQSGYSVRRVDEMFEL